MTGPGKHTTGSGRGTAGTKATSEVASPAPGRSRRRPPASGPRPAAGSGPHRRLTAVLAVLGLGLALVGAGLALRPDPAPPAVEITAGSTNVVVNQDADSIDSHNSPTMVVDPTDPETLVVAGRIDHLEFSARLHVSSDRGRTWTDVEIPVPPGHERPYVPDIAFAPEGTLLVLFATLDADGNPAALWLERSTDAGSTFSAPVQVTGPYAYQGRLAVAGGSGDIHVTWLQADADVVGIVDGIGPPPNPVVMATSRDGGDTFANPVPVSEPARQRVGAATPVVGPDGIVFVLYQDYGDDAADFEGLPGPVHDGTFALVLARSADRGDTVETVGVVEPDVVPFSRFSVYRPQFPSLAVDPDDGSLYVAWAHPTGGDRDVFLRRSDDGGRTWSDRIQVNSDGSSTAQYLPEVSVGPDGRVDVVYLTRSGDPENDVLTAAHLATSFDQGMTWHAIVLSDTLFDARIGPGSERPQGADAGSRLGLVSVADGAYAVWADSRRGTPGSDKQDLVFAPVRIVTTS